ncbi:hypothetical protein Bca101_018044 [Brassica carinata]
MKTITGCESCRKWFCWNLSCSHFSRCFLSGFVCFMVLESRDRIGGRVHTDYSFGFPVDLGASWYDHDLESYALFDMDGNPVPQELVRAAGITFEQILEEISKVRDEEDADMSISQAFSIVFSRKPELRLEGLAHNVLQWSLLPMLIASLHSVGTRGYPPVINTLAKGLDIRLNHRVTKIVRKYNRVKVTTEDGETFVADPAVIAVPLGVLKSGTITFEPKLPEYDHDLESYALFEMDGNQVPQELVRAVGITFEQILEEINKETRVEVRGACTQCTSMVLVPLEGWFAADSDSISAQCWDQEELLPGGHGLMVRGYRPVINTLAKGIDIRLNHSVSSSSSSQIKQYNGVKVTTEDGETFVAEAAVIAVPLGLLEVTAETSYGCSYFLNLHKATGHPVLVYISAGRLAKDIEKMSDEAAASFPVMQLQRIIFPDAMAPVQCLVSRWGSDVNSFGSYSYDVVGKPHDLNERFRVPVDNLLFSGEATS